MCVCVYRYIMCYRYTYVQYKNKARPGKTSLEDFANSPFATWQHLVEGADIQTPRTCARRVPFCRSQEPTAVLSKRDTTDILFEPVHLVIPTQWDPSYERLGLMISPHQPSTGFNCSQTMAKQHVARHVCSISGNTRYW